jgi:LysR family transcriptional regulator, hydrogen peroxide-inducible genes activator
VAAARAALAAVAAVEHAAAEAKPPFFGPVRLGSIPTVAPYALPFVTQALERAHPTLELPIREGTTAELLSALDHGRIDVALLALLPGMSERYACAPLYREPFLVAMPRNHALAARKQVTMMDVAQERLLLLDEGHCLREQALELCRLRSETAGVGADYRATSLETLRQMVAAGAGITVLPLLAGGEADKRVAIKPWPGAERTIVLLWRSTDPRGDAYARLAPPIRAALPDGVIRA